MSKLGLMFFPEWSVTESRNQRTFRRKELKKSKRSRFWDAAKLNASGRLVCRGLRKRGAKSAWP